MATIEESALAAPDELRILDAEGVLLSDSEPSLSTEHLRPILAAMLRVRWLEKQLTELHQQGRIGYFAARPGEEAAVVGAAAALRPEDWVFTGHGDLGVLLWRGVSLQRCLDNAFGNASDSAKGRVLPGFQGARAVNVVGASGLPGNHLVHAAGCGWSARSQNDALVSAALFRESAAESSDFHTALNFAGVFRSATVFLGRNRGERGALAAKAVAYGVEGVLCDGLDPLAVLTATAHARQRALSGKGPTLVELFLGAGTDPIERSRRFLEAQGAWSGDAQRALEASFEAELREAVAHALQAPPPPVASLFDDTFVRPPWHLSEQRAALTGGLTPGDRSMEQVNMVKAINGALRLEMARDRRVVVLGEDVGKVGGVFRVTDGLHQEFGEDRVIDTPLSEGGIIGTAIGMALYGMVPVAEIQFSDFIFPAYDQIVSELAKMRYRSGGEYAAKMVIRTPVGGGIRGGLYHSQSPESLFIHVAGLKVVCPSTPYDAKGLLLASIRDPDPVIFLEPKRVYRAAKGEVPEGDYTVDLGRAAIRREGSDVTVVSWGAMVYEALEAAQQASAQGVEAEVIDLRTLWPLDLDTLLQSVQKTGRLVVVHEAPRSCGFGAEVVSLIAERAFLHLQAPPTRVAGWDTPFPYTLENDYLPLAHRILPALLSTAKY
jgi:2-oxoisovalerate dehydrogenase E1 component beta subunit